MLHFTVQFDIYFTLYSTVRYVPTSYLTGRRIVKVCDTVYIKYLTPMCNVILDTYLSRYNVTGKCLMLQVSVKSNVTGKCLMLQVSV